MLMERSPRAFQFFSSILQLVRLSDWVAPYKCPLTIRNRLNVGDERWEGVSNRVLIWTPSCPPYVVGMSTGSRRNRLKGDQLPLRSVRGLVSRESRDRSRCHLTCVSYLSSVCWFQFSVLEQSFVRSEQCFRFPRFHDTWVLQTLSRVI